MRFFLILLILSWFGYPTLLCNRLLCLLLAVILAVMVASAVAYDWVSNHGLYWVWADVVTENLSVFFSLFFLSLYTYDIRNLKIASNKYEDHIAAGELGQS